MSTTDEPERDAWLTEALRHAPDAQAAPPAALSESILRQARAAVRTDGPAPARPPRDRLAAAWAWLGRPAVAAGFASVMVAVLVGVMWWDRPLDSTLSPPRPDAPRPAEAPSLAIAPVLPPNVATSPQPIPPDTASSFAAPETTRDPRAVKQKTESVAPAPATAATRGGKSLPGSAAAKHSAPPLATAPEPPVRAVLTPAPGRAPDEVPAQVPAPAADSASPVPAMAAAAPASVPPGPARALAERQRNLAQENREDRLSTAAAGSSGLGSPGRPSALSASLASVAADPGRWTYNRGAGSHPMTPALQAWLSRLDRAAAARWTTHAARPPSPAATLQLFRDGDPALTLLLADRAVWIAPDNRAELTTEADSLQNALTEAAP